MPVPDLQQGLPLVSDAALICVDCLRSVLLGTRGNACDGGAVLWRQLAFLDSQLFCHRMLLPLQQQHYDAVHFRSKQPTRLLLLQDARGMWHERSAGLHCNSWPVQFQTQLHAR